MAGKTVFRLVQMSVVLAIALALATCGGSKRAVVQGLSPGSSQDNKTSPEGLDYQADTAISLDESLVELEGMETPDGVDEALWMELKDALGEAFSCRAETIIGGAGVSPANHLNHGRDARATSGVPYKWVATPPTGEANRVDDLIILDMGDGTFTLSWHYKNLGDYDQNGKVGISDITPLAIHYGEIYDPTDVNCLLAVIDSSGNGAVDIADITPLALNFGTEVSEYTIQGAWEFNELYEDLDTAPFSTIAETTTGRGVFNYSVIFGDAYFVRVMPVNGQGIASEPSNEAAFMPYVVRVMGAEGRTLEETILTAEIVGALPLTYEWSIEGGTPGKSGDESPLVALGETGDYECHITVTNSLGMASRAFRLHVSSWDIEAIPLDMCGVTCLAFDPDGNPAITCPGEIWTKAKLARWDGEEWNVWTFGREDAETPSVYFVCVAFDSAGLPAVAYADLGDSSLQFRKFDGATWHAETVDSIFSDEWGGQIDLAFDSSDNAYIAYWHDGEEEGYVDVRLAYQQESEWSTELVDPSAASGCGYGWLSITLDSEGNPGIAHTGRGHAELALREGSDWVVTELDEHDLTSGASLAFDSNDYPAVSYYRSGFDADLGFTRWDGTSWERTIVDDDGAVGLYSSISCERSGQPTIAYCGYAYTTGGLRLASWDGSYWEIETVSHGCCAWSSLAFDKEGRAAISYCLQNEYRLFLARDLP